MTSTTSTVPSGAYALDPIHSSIGFALTYNGAGKFRNRFDALDARLEDGVLVGSADVTSIGVDEPHFRDHLMGAEFFDAETTPSITFRSTEITLGEEDHVTVTGELTIRGTTRTVVGEGVLVAATDAMGKDRATFTLVTTVDRRDFGMTWQMALPGGGDSLGYDVEITLDLALVKQG